MSTSTTMSTSGFINRRSMPAARKPRPASIAGTVVSLEGEYWKKCNKDVANQQLNSRFGNRSMN